MYICPHDFMALDKDGSVTGHAMKAYYLEPEQCWECSSCVKICPQQAIECRACAEVVPMGGSVQPLRGTDSIMWSLKFHNGNVKRFKFQIRTTLEGSADPVAGMPKPDMANLESPSIFFRTICMPATRASWSTLKYTQMHSQFVGLLNCSAQ